MSRTNNSLSELSEFTVAVIKPDAVKAGYVEDIVTELNDYGGSLLYYTLSFLREAK